MIQYHGGPITPVDVAVKFFKGRHAMVSFARPEQLRPVAEVADSFAIDNGAFSFWTAGAGAVDVPAYAAFVRDWCRHPGFDWCVIPDVIDGAEEQNDALIEQWTDFGFGQSLSVPVWHLHETIDRLVRLGNTFPRVAMGSSGEWASVGSKAWEQRMTEALNALCDVGGHPPCKLHGLRMLRPSIISQVPLASGDSCNVARNIGMDSAWDNAPYAPESKYVRALIIAQNTEGHATAKRWAGRFAETDPRRARGFAEENLELFG